MNTYTDAQVAHALAALALNAGNVKRTARELAIPEPTLRTWSLKAIARAGVKPEIKQAYEHDFSEMWATAQTLAHQYLVQKAPEAPFRDLVTWAGVSADKHLDYSQGRKGGTQVNVDARTQSVTVQYVDRRLTGGEEQDA